MCFARILFSFHLLWYDKRQQTTYTHIRKGSRNRKKKFQLMKRIEDENIDVRNGKYCIKKRKKKKRPKKKQNNSNCLRRHRYCWCFCFFALNFVLFLLHFCFTAAKNILFLSNRWFGFLCFAFLLGFVSLCECVCVNVFFFVECHSSDASFAEFLMSSTKLRRSRHPNYMHMVIACTELTHLFSHTFSRQFLSIDGM